MAPLTNPLWGDDWDEVRSNWILDPDIAFLNHGSYGATPRIVLDRQHALRDEMEREPITFLWRRLPDLAEEALAEAAAFVGAEADGLAFVTNATTGVNTVLASLPLGAGDRLVTTDHVYPAVHNAMRAACARAGAELVEVPIPLPLWPDEMIVDAVTSALTARTRLVLIDHVTSSTAAILPVGRIAAACRSAGVPVMVDAAHGPGMVPIDVGALDVDFWTGNLHKWVCAPKGSALLWVAPEHRERTHPLVVSHGAGEGFRAEFDWTGTHDPTPYLSVPAAIGFMGGFGWPRVMAHNHRLALHAQRVVSSALGTPAQIPDDERSGSMGLSAFPTGMLTAFEDALALQERLFTDHAIEVPVTRWDGRAFVRLSAQVYNAPTEYERLASVLAGIVAAARSDT